MKNFLTKPFRWTVVFSLTVALTAAFIFLYTLVIPRAGEQITVNPINTTVNPVDTTVNPVDTTSTPATTQPVYIPVVKTKTTYKDANIEIKIDTVRRFNTTVYVADIKISSVAYLKTAFAKNTYGRNIKELTSVMAKNNNAIFAINGDFYGFRDYGFVLRNGILYREVPRPANADEALAIDKNGDFLIINENQTNADTLVSSGVLQVISFGPALINNDIINVNAHSEVAQAWISNPRTAIGQVSKLHYIVIVSDGRTKESAGLSLLQLAELFKERGCAIAYNLDGGGSSVMYFNGRVVNLPINLNAVMQRSVSDIVYFGYK